jgi:hypothetical protein
MAGVEGLCDSIFDKHVAQQQQEQEQQQQQQQQQLSPSYDGPNAMQSIQDASKELEEEELKEELEEELEEDQEEECLEEDCLEEVGQLRELEAEKAILELGLAEEKVMHKSTAALWWAEKEKLEAVTLRLEEEKRHLSASWEAKFADTVKDWESRLKALTDTTQEEAKQAKDTVDWWKQRQAEVAKSSEDKLDAEEKRSLRERYMWHVRICVL